MLQNKGIKILENKIERFVGENGQMEKIIFENGGSVLRKGGFVMPQLVQASDFGKQFGCEYNPLGGIAVDSFGRTNIQGVYAAGDASVINPAQLIIAAADGVPSSSWCKHRFNPKRFFRITKLVANTTINRNINAINTDTTVSTVQPNGVLYTKEQGFIMTSSIFEVIRSAASS